MTNGITSLVGPLISILSGSDALARHEWPCYGALSGVGDTKKREPTAK